MSSKTVDRLTPGQRLGRGLKYTAVGPVDLTRGAVGVGVDAVRCSAAWVGDRYCRGGVTQQLKADLTSAQDTLVSELGAAQRAAQEAAHEVATNLPEAFEKARKSRGRRRPLLLTGIGVAVLVAGAAAFSIIRRSTQPEPSPLPPSVEVSPKP